MMHRPLKPDRAVLAAALLAAAPLPAIAPAVAQTGAGSSDAPAPAPAPRAVDPAEAAGFATADELLDALERADRHIRTFTSPVMYDRILELQGDRQTRTGTLYFAALRPDGDGAGAREGNGGGNGGGSGGGSGGGRVFAVRFTHLFLDDVRHEDRQDWIFDGRWLVERRYAAEQYVAREMARPGDEIDPLRLGEGPLPIPIGQRKADILARYEVELLPGAAGWDAEDESVSGYARFGAGAAQLKLTPRPEIRDDDRFREIRLWYRRGEDGSVLPIMSRTRDRKGDVAIVQLAQPEVNTDLPEEVIDIEPPEDPAWDIRVERLPPEEGVAAADGGEE